MSRWTIRGRTFEFEFEPARIAREHPRLERARKQMIDESGNPELVDTFLTHRFAAAVGKFGHDYMGEMSKHVDRIFAIRDEMAKTVDTAVRGETVHIDALQTQFGDLSRELDALASPRKAVETTPKLAVPAEPPAQTHEPSIREIIARLEAELAERGPNQPPVPPGAPGRSPTADVWVQLRDGRVRAYEPREVRGDLDRGTQVTTPDGGGTVVGRGDAPRAGQVRQPAGFPGAPPPLITTEELNAVVPRARSAKAESRPLNAAERAIAKTLLEALEDVNRGHEAAIHRTAPFRPHLHDRPGGQFYGWYSVDLVNVNSALNIMRIYFRKGANGLFEAKLRQFH